MKRFLVLPFLLLGLLALPARADDDAEAKANLERARASLKALEAKIADLEKRLEAAKDAPKEEGKAEPAKTPAESKTPKVEIEISGDLPPDAGKTIHLVEKLLQGSNDEDMAKLIQQGMKFFVAAQNGEDDDERAEPAARAGAEARRAQAERIRALVAQGLHAWMNAQREAPAREKPAERADAAPMKELREAISGLRDDIRSLRDEIRGLRDAFRAAAAK